MIQKLTIEDKYIVTIYDSHTISIDTLKPYPGIRNIDCQIEPNGMIFGDNEQTRQYAFDKYNEMLKAIHTVKECHIEFTVLYSIYENIEQQILCEIEGKTFSGTTGRKLYTEKVRNALRFVYNDLFRHLFAIEGDVESSPNYLPPYLLYQILKALEKDEVLDPV